MDDLRKKILMDLFVTTGTVVPTVIGLSMIMLSFVFGGPLAFFGFLGLLFGFGALITNFVFNLKGISQRAVKSWHAAESKKQDAQLDSLDKKLIKTNDPRDQTHLRNLRQLFKSFSNDVTKGKLSEHVPVEMVAQVDEIFSTCINSLDQSYEIFKMAKEMEGNLKDGLLHQREAIIEDVGRSVERLSSVINEVRALKLKAKGSQLKRLRENLNSSLQIAQHVDEAVRDLDGNEDRFSEYE